MTAEECVIGTRVIMVNDDPEYPHGDANGLLVNGMTGTIVAINDNQFVNVGVEWDVDPDDMELHTLGGEIDEDRGWWCDPLQLAPIGEPIEESELDIGFLIGGM